MENASNVTLNSLVLSAGERGGERGGEKGERGGEEDFLTFDPNDVYVQRALEHLKFYFFFDLFLLSLSESIFNLLDHRFSVQVMSGEDPTILCIYGMILTRLKKFQTAEQLFIQSIDSNPKFFFAMIEYMNFLQICDKKSLSEKMYRFLSQLKDQLIVSPFTIQELGGVTKIFLMDGTFKSISCNATMNSVDVSVLISRALKIPFDSLNMKLFLCHGTKLDPLSLSQREAVILSSPIQYLRASDLPWVLLQRPKGFFFCIFIFLS